MCIYTYTPGAPFSNMVQLALRSNYIHHKLWNDIASLFPNFNGATVEVWISNFIPHITRHVITYPCWE